MMEVMMLTTRTTIRRARLQSNHHLQQTVTQLFTGRMPFLSPNHVRALKGKSITFHGPAHPKLIWGLPFLALTAIDSWLPWGMVAKHLISPLLPVPNPAMFS